MNKADMNVINSKLSHCAELMVDPPHTASIDPQIIRDIGIRVTERVLSEAYGKKVTIRESRNYEITFNKSRRHETATYYIAEVKDAEV